MTPKTLEDWVRYLQTLHARDIDLTLERVRTVFQRLRPHGVEFKIITVAGTNGKGSTCEMLASIYHAAGYQSGKFTSPHVLTFNERFSINHSVVSDSALLRVLRRVDAARESVGLTFFEFGTLAAIELFADQGVDIAIMEVGLGGRLDAVNILDADITVISSISVDHTDWLGDSFEKIALEKIGVARAGKPCVISLTEPPASMKNYCQLNKVPVSQLGVDFDYEWRGATWCWRSNSKSYDSLALPFGQAGVQLQNASAAIMAIQHLQNVLPIRESAINEGLVKATLQGRCQIVARAPLIVVDVAHNEASIASLLTFIESLDVSGKTYVICGMLKDKQIKQSLEQLIEVVDQWNLVSIQSDRGADAQFIQSTLNTLSNNLLSFCFDDVESAYNSVQEKINMNDALIVFGSFFIVGDIIPLLKANRF